MQHLLCILEMLLRPILIQNKQVFLNDILPKLQQANTYYLLHMSQTFPSGTHTFYIVSF